jgi:hypothetical protein
MLGVAFRGVYRQAMVFDGPRIGVKSFHAILHGFVENFEKGIGVVLFRRANLKLRA